MSSVRKKEWIGHCFLTLSKGEVLSRCSVLVTSRPYASENLQCLHSVVRHVEVLGFTEEQIHQCITNAIKGETKAQALVNVLKQRGDVFSLCYIPLNCAILLYVYQQQDFALPDTLTKLFEIFILHALKRNVKVQSEHRLAKKIHNLMALPSRLDCDLNHLCELAFDGLVKDKVVFQYEEIETAVCMVDQEIESKFLGLLTAFKSFPAVGDNMTYQFLHLTIQEFLAARWVATHTSPEEQAKFFKDHLPNNRFRMMLLFLSGITKLDDSSFSVVFSAELDFLISDEERRRMVEMEDLLFHLAHFLYESQNPTHCHTLACAIKEQTIVLRRNVPLFLFLAFAFFLSRSRCTWKRLDIGTNAIHHEELDVLCEQLGKESSSVCIQQLQVVDSTRVFSGVFPVAINKLAKIVNIPAFRCLQKLEIMGSPLLFGTRREITDVHLSSSDLDSLRCLIRNGALEELALLGVTGMNDKVIERCIAPELAKTMTLKVLDIGSVAISNDGLCSLFHALEHNKSVETLHVLKYMRGDLRPLALAVESALKVNQTIKVLSFIDNAPMSVGRINTIAEYPGLFYGGLFRVIAVDNSTLKSLTITEDQFVVNLEVVVSLIGMLHKNKSLTSLSLSVGQLHSDLLNMLAVGLVQNTVLTRLCVRSRYTTLEPSLALFGGALCLNSSLKTLVLDVQFAEYTAGNFGHVRVWGEENFASFLGMLRLNKSLTSISFIYPFTDDQLKAIAQHLVLNGHMRDIELIFEYPYQQSRPHPHSFQSYCESIIQEEVNKYKRVV